ncbi:MAG TPA: 7-carboxy-7-deazaguanine synthase [Acidobacteriaceae bacterium]|jgi:7-carboxy-7-deazaguanine synthase (Cx14CxxC type)
MPYAVKEIFYTLQGEGMNAGRAAVFCRFSGCNLWSGREADRAQAVCQFCDTDFVGTNGDGGDKFSSAQQLAEEIAQYWPKHVSGQRFVVCTGGEPLLQLDSALIDALHQLNFWVAVETNGTIAVPKGVDWVCVSPKAGAPLSVTHGDELKVVYPQATDPNEYLNLEFSHFFIQPLDGPDSSASVAAAIAFCQNNPSWRLSLQTHKIIGIR